MRHLVHAAAGAAVLACGSAAHAQVQPEMGQPVALRDASGLPMGTRGNPLVASDPNNAAFHGARVLTPSGTAGTAGTVSTAPYPATTGSVPATSATAGYSFTWVCSSAGSGSITLTDGSVLPYAFTAGSNINRDAFAIVDAEPGSASGCTFGVLR